jgi:YHS domain-containing protein
MKTLKMLVIAVIAVCCSAGSVSAAEYFNNPVCPVSGEEVSNEFSVEHDGIIYFFSSTEASAQFEKAPDKYLKKLPNEGTIADMLNEVCPVSGQAAQKDYYVVFNGTKVHTKCGGTMRIFANKAEYYLARAKRIEGMTKEELKKEFAKVTKFNNRTCPVTGNPATRLHTAQHNDIEYKFATKEAAAQFEKSPDTYLTKLPNAGKIVDLDNHICPVAADKIQRKLAVIIDGQKIYCDCMTCARAILKDPDTHIERVKKFNTLKGTELEAYIATIPKCSEGGCTADHSESTSKSACSDCASKDSCSSATKTASTSKSACSDCASKDSCSSKK